LQSNAISEILPFVFTPLGTAFTALSMAANRLSTVGNGYFSDLRNLTTLDVKSNLITSLEPGAFSNNVMLTNLYVSAMTPLWHHQNGEQKRLLARNRHDAD
jgi:Leucine-rich repeat (LRR) protein